MNTTETAAIEGQDADKGKLFEVPRVAVLVDESDPTILKVSFSGQIELDRNNASDVELFNSFRPGQDVRLTVEAYVAGPKNTHRRDADGFLEDIVQTKNLAVHSLVVDDQNL